MSNQISKTCTPLGATPPSTTLLGKDFLDSDELVIRFDIKSDTPSGMESMMRSIEVPADFVSSSVLRFRPPEIFTEETCMATLALSLNGGHHYEKSSQPLHYTYYREQSIASINPPLGKCFETEPRTPPWQFDLLICH